MTLAIDGVDLFSCGMMLVDHLLTLTPNLTPNAIFASLERHAHPDSEQS